MSQLILVGGGGHCRACIDVIEREGRHAVAGIIDLPEKIGTQVLGYKINATDRQIAEMVCAQNSFLVTVGQIKTASLRKKIYDSLEEAGARIVSIVSPLACVSPHARIGAGTIVMHYAMLGPSVEVGENCIINSRALVEHDTVIGSHCHIATGAIVNGGCFIGDEVFVGSGAVIREQVRIAPRTVIGCGATVRKDVVDPGSTVT